MGYEKSEPRNMVILITAIGSTLLLLGIIPLFHTYYDSMFLGEFDDKVEESGVGEDIASSQARVDGASVSLSDAMERLSSGNRRGTPVQPRATDSFDLGEEEGLTSLGPVKGWSAHERLTEEANARAAMLESRAREQARRDAAAAAAAAAAAEGESPTALLNPARPIMPRFGIRPPQ
ncbi:MAG: hypothetical protein AB8H86_14540 [Polyangiales bacterium]